jgi:hypothetical protein
MALVGAASIKAGDLGAENHVVTHAARLAVVRTAHVASGSQWIATDRKSPRARPPRRHEIPSPR